MDLFILDKDFNTIAVVDYFESVLWNDKYRECGEFEIYTTSDADIVGFISDGFYLWNKNSEHQMIIEQISLTSDSENGNKLIAKGRSLESILDRRILWDKKKMTGNVQNGVKTLIEENFINPTIPERKIANIVFSESTDERITSLEFGDEVEFDAGEEIYDAIVSICETFNMGFKLVMDSEYNFVFSLYKGVDRSYKQDNNPYVTFSKKLENLIESDYAEDSHDYKNLALVIHENGEGEPRSETQVTVTEETGLYRREVFVTADNVDSSDPPETILAKMIQSGRNALEEAKISKVFNCQLDSEQTFEYGKDFYLGDIVQVVNEYGMEFRSRVIEYVTSYASDGINIYPSFEVVNEYFEV